MNKKVFVATITLVEKENPDDTHETPLDIYKLDEEELRQYGAKNGLSELQQDILVFRVKDHLKICEICEYRKYSRSTIKYHLGEIKKKLKLNKI